MLGLGVDLCEYQQEAEVLLDLGLRRQRVMSNNPLTASFEGRGPGYHRARCPRNNSGSSRQTLPANQQQRMSHLLQLY